jgi:hypothetical protein
LRSSIPEAVAVVTALALLAFLVVPATLPRPTTSVTLIKAGNASYALGSSLHGTFVLRHNAVVTGAFVANGGVWLVIQQAGSHGVECQGSTYYCYNTGNVTNATIDTTLVTGTYEDNVAFPGPNAQTWFNVTQSLVATYQK